MIRKGGWMRGHKLIYFVITLLFFILLAYLGIRTLEHEVLLRQYQAQTLAQSQAASVAGSIDNILLQNGLGYRYQAS